MTPGLPPRRIVVVGDIMTDVVTRLDEPPAPDSDAAATIVLTGGGSGANVAAWTAYLHHPVTMVGRVGADPEGRARCQELAALGVDLRVAVDPERATGTCVVLVAADGGRTMLPDRAANLALDVTDLPADLFRGGGHLHLSGYLLLDPGPRPAAHRALRLAGAAGMTVSVDTSSSAPLDRCGPGRFAEWTREVDLLIANAAEAALLAHRLPDYRNMVITRGSDGAGWWRAGRTVAEVAAPPTRVIDTTGAGDSFTAGLLTAWLGGAGPVAALTAGAQVAAGCVARIGARPVSHFTRPVAPQTMTKRTDLPPPGE